MGWCSGTQVFDSVVAGLIGEKPKEEVVKDLITALEDLDWDCQGDSDYYSHPLVQKAMREIHPKWFTEEESQ